MPRSERLLKIFSELFCMLKDQSVEESGAHDLKEMFLREIYFQRELGGLDEHLSEDILQDFLKNNCQKLEGSSSFGGFLGSKSSSTDNKKTTEVKESKPKLTKEEMKGEARDCISELTSVFSNEFISEESLDKLDLMCLKYEDLLLEQERLAKKVWKQELKESAHYPASKKLNKLLKAQIDLDKKIISAESKIDHWNYIGQKWENTLRETMRRFSNLDTPEGLQLKKTMKEIEEKKSQLLGDFEGRENQALWEIARKMPKN